MEKKQFFLGYIIMLILLLCIAVYVGYQQLKYIDTMRHSPCDLCPKCPNNILREKAEEWSLPDKFLGDFKLENGSEIQT